MSFRCPQCKSVAAAGNTWVEETREKTYTETRMERGREITIQTGRGLETVREVRLCTKCWNERLEQMRERTSEARVS